MFTKIMNLLFCLGVIVVGLQISIRGFTQKNNSEVVLNYGESRYFIGGVILLCGAAMLVMVLRGKK